MTVRPCPGEDASEGVLDGPGQPQVFVEHVGERLLRQVGGQALAEPLLEAVLTGQRGVDLGPRLPIAAVTLIGAGSTVPCP